VNGLPAQFLCGMPGGIVKTLVIFMVKVAVHGVSFSLRVGEGNFRQSPSRRKQHTAQWGFANRAKAWASAKCPGWLPLRDARPQL
jgi:hypothetical protein